MATNTPKVPWGLVVAFAAIAAIVTVVLRLVPGSEHSGFSAAMWPPLLIGWTMFLSERWLQNYVWGLIAALMLTLHPYFIRWANSGETLLWAEAAGLVVLAATIAAWQILFQKHFRPLGWVVIALIMVVATGLVWLQDLRMGLVTSLLTLGGLFLGAFLATKKHSQASLCWGNISLAGLLAILAPLGGLALAVFAIGPWQILPRGASLPLTENLWDWLEKAFQPGTGDLSLIAAELERWSLAGTVVLLALMVLGLWRSLRRGWKCWRGGQPPLAWVLTMFVVIDLAAIVFQPPSVSNIALLPLAPIAVLLTVFALADLAQSLGERLVLSPPQER